MSMKTAQEARKGDRVWVKDGERLSIGIIYDDHPSPTCRSIKVGDHPYTYSISSYVISDFGTTWGYLVDNETVIGGQILRNPKPNLWYVGVGSYWADSILENHKGFDDWCKTLDLSDADKAAIQEHVRKHSAHAKRTAADAEEGDEIWITSMAGHVKRKVDYRYPDSVLVNDGSVYELAQFGTDWGFWEDRPDAQEAKPDNAITHWGKLPESDDTTQALPVVEPAAKPNPDSDAAILARKGAQWVRVNRPDIWKRLKADLMDKTRRASDKLARPGILAGKTASPWV